MNIGKAIKQLRTRANLNQQEFAKECGITQTSISQIEANKKRPNIGSLRKICCALEIPIALIYLMALDESDLTEQRVLHLNTYLKARDILIDILQS